MKKIFLALGTLLMGGILLAQDPSALHSRHYNLEHGLAIQGYDPVSYFSDHKAVKGKKENALVLEGVTYYFATPEHRDEFRQNPQKYEPAYGGWCAYAMGAKGQKVSVDPETFKIVDGKLNLFYNKFFNNTLEDWNKDEGNLKKKAEANWQKIYH